MNIQTIRRLQRDHGYADMQNLIESGEVWKLEGSYGRQAMDLLRCGACFLPKEPKIDYYGNVVPSRDSLECGTTGTFTNSVRFFTENFN
jgi:hypothetical protein